MTLKISVPLQIKALSDREFEGHGSVFKNIDLGGDIVAPGAFKRSLASHRKAGSLPQMFWMHDPARVPGKWLSMQEDERGLKVKGVLADTPLGNEIHALLKMEAVRGLSIGYRTVDQDWTDDGARVIKEAELWEVSVVSLPMNPLAQVAHVKSQLSADGEYVPTPREFERMLRYTGCSQRVAKTILSKLFDLDARDVTGGIDCPRDVVVVEDSDADELVRAAKAVEDMLLALTVRSKLKL